MLPHPLQDELLCACLELLLAAPASLVQVAALGPALQQALALGLQYPPLAEQVLAALARWEEQGAGGLEVLLPQVGWGAGVGLAGVVLCGADCCGWCCGCSVLWGWLALAHWLACLLTLDGHGFACPAVCLLAHTITIHTPSLHPHCHPPPTCRCSPSWSHT
jgi:hypothetical protein